MINVSIHAPIKDATLPATIYHFLRFVSIHAPIKDATEVPDCDVIQDSFNPRTHKGCDSVASLFTFFVFMFQSTHP